MTLMNITYKKLPQNRYKYEVEISAAKVDEYFGHALKHLAEGQKLPGFRKGKAPEKLVKEQIDPTLLREEAYSLAVRDAWLEIIKDLKETPIEDPQVEVGVFEEGIDAKLSYEFDVKPEVKIGDWQKISIKADKQSEVTDKEVDEVINSLSRGYASTIVKLDESVLGDKLEVSFTGSVDNVVKDKLTAKKFELILGTDGVIPGFAEELVGLKKGEDKKFTLDFPKDHFDKEFAGKKVTFDVHVDEVYEVVMPEIDAEFAKKFGHETPNELRTAIKTDLQDRKKDEQFSVQKAKWLAEFEKKVTVQIPKSLIENEVARTKESWENFLESRHISREDWLTRQDTTMDKLQKDWEVAAKSSVTIGLGLGEVAKELKKELKTNDDFHQMLDDLVKKSVK